MTYPPVPRSITNPTVKKIDAVDVSDPMSFLTFIKIINVSFESATLQKYYTNYIQQWNKKVNSKSVDSSTQITERYRDFIKEITLNHTTLEEKQFLSKIDFNDPYDLDVALGFYSRKLKAIALYYNSKRNDVKFNVTRNKLTGTPLGLTKSITELTLNYLKNYDDGKILFNYDDVKGSIEIEVEEMYDAYSQYFNQTPDAMVYDHKDLDYGLDIFLNPDSTLIAQTLSSLSQELQQIKEVNQIFENKRKLTQKYISTDFYYLSTGNIATDFLSGQLFKADTPVLNIVNQSFPTTASTQQSSYLLTERELGFFKPHKLGIILVDGKNSSFSFNLDNLTPNTLYYFPDPTLFGTSGEVLTFIVDDSSLKRNYSSGNAVNQPYSSQYDTKYYGYVSKIEPNVKKYLDSVFDSGFIEDIKRDIYGNLFGLFKNDHRHRQTIQTKVKPTTYSLIINGGEIYDELYGEGYTFNYLLSDYTTFRETFRSGLSTNCAPITSTALDSTLFFGYFNPYFDTVAPSEHVLTYQVLEGAYVSLPELSSSDLSAFSSLSSGFYYSTLIEGGIHNASTMVRALSDSLYPTITANATQTTRLSTLTIIDGGVMGTYFDDLVSLTEEDKVFDTTVLNPTVYTLSTTPYDDNWNIKGKIYVKNHNNREIEDLLTALPHLSTRYSTISTELSTNVQSFDIVKDVLFIKTPNNLIIDKLFEIDSVLSNPKTNVFNLQHSTNQFDKVSNRFSVDGDVYFCKLSALSADSTNNFIIYPEIYKHDAGTYKTTKIYPLGSVSEFALSDEVVRYTKVDEPKLTYNSRNNIFNVSFLLKDQNDMFEMINIDFEINPDVNILSKTVSKLNVPSESNILTTLSSLNTYTSSGVSISGDELVL